MAIKSKAAQRARRHARIRKYVSGTAARPRLCVTRSTRHMFVQVIDDVKGVTLASASTMEAELRAADLDKTAKAKRVGELVAERAKAAGVEACSTAVVTSTTAVLQPLLTVHAREVLHSNERAERKGNSGERSSSS